MQIIETKDGALDILKVTPKNYIVKENEKDYFHCRIEVKKFSPETGERFSVPSIQIFEPKMFTTFGLHNLKQQGYSVDILHDPTKKSKKDAK